jgi:hypothetical protein
VTKISHHFIDRPVERVTAVELHYANTGIGRRNIKYPIIRRKAQLCSKISSEKRKIMEGNPDRKVIVDSAKEMSSLKT